MCLQITGCWHAWLWEGVVISWQACGCVEPPGETVYILSDRNVAVRGAPLKISLSGAEVYEAQVGGESIW